MHREPRGGEDRLIIMRARLALFVAAALLTASCGAGNDDSTSVNGDVAPDQSTAGDVSAEVVAFEPSPDVARAEVSDAAVPDLVTGFNDAGFALLRREPVDGNLVLSPTSIGHAVLMARAAADDATGDAIDQALALPSGLAAHDAWNAIDAAVSTTNGTAVALDDSPTPIVTIADRIWPSQDARPDQAWIDLLAAYHGADVEAIDTGRPEASRALINEWISEQTNAMSKRLRSSA